MGRKPKGSATCREKPYVRLDADLHYTTKVLAVQIRSTHTDFIEKLVKLGLEVYSSKQEGKAA